MFKQLIISTIFINTVFLRCYNVEGSSSDAIKIEQELRENLNLIGINDNDIDQYLMEKGGSDSLFDTLTNNCTP